MPVPYPDWRGAWILESADGTERDPQDAMIGWLASQPPTTWHAFVKRYLNRDFSDRVAAWIAVQPACDRATAALLTLGADPAWYLDQPPLTPLDSLLSLVLKQWERGAYRTSAIHEDLAEEAGFLTSYRTAAARPRPRPPRFVLPEELLGPFHGVVADFPTGWSPYVRPEMWALIHYLGVDVPNEATDRWRERDEAARERWIEERRCAPFWVRLLWDPEAIVPFGPDLESEDERERYLAGDAKVSRRVFERAKRRARGW